MSYTRKEWFNLGKLLYKPVARPLLVKFVKSTTNDFDDDLLRAFDKFMNL